MAKSRERVRLICALNTLLAYFWWSESCPSALILVGGATGRVGRQCCERLSAGGHNVRVPVRDTGSEKAKELAAMPHVLTCVGDYGDPGSLSSAFEGVRGALLACNNVLDQAELETNFIAAAEASASCKYLVKLSTAGPDGYIGPDSMIEYGKFHAEAEDRLARCQEGRLRWTCLRPNCFFQNHVGDLFGSIPAAGIIAYPHVDAGASIVDTRDVGDVAAGLLADVDASADAHHAKKLDISGPDAWTATELASLYADELGKPVSAVPVDAEGFRASLVKAGFPGWLATAVMHTHSDFWAKGKFNYPSSPEVSTLLATPPRTFRAWVRELL